MSKAVDSISTVNAPFDILVLGNKGVGKTTLIQKYILGDSPLRPQDTSECITFKTIELSCDCSQNTNYHIPSASVHKSVSILDSSAEINDLLTTDSYQIKNARTMLFTYAVDDSDSFGALDYTINCITSVRQELPPCLVVCLKIDNNIDRQVSFEQGKELANACGAIDFIETCAVSHLSVDNVFAPLVEEVLRIQDQESPHHGEECYTGKMQPPRRLSVISSSEIQTAKQESSTKLQPMRAKTLTFDSENNGRYEEKGTKNDTISSMSRDKLTKTSSVTSLDNKTQTSDITKYEDAKSSFRTWTRDKSANGKPSGKRENRCCIIM